MAKHISEYTKKLIAGNQFHRCANDPDPDSLINKRMPKESRGLGNFECPLYKIQGENRGLFGPGGYQIDHIVEKARKGSNNETNLQALCQICHAYKTSKFMAKHMSKHQELYENEDLYENEKSHENEESCENEDLSSNNTNSFGKMDTILCQILSCGITDKKAAELFYFDNKEKCVYCETNNSWYLLNEFNIWKKDSKGYVLIKRLGDELPKKIISYYKAMSKQSEVDEKYSKNLKKAKKLLEMNRSKKTIIEELKGYFISNTVYEQMDNVNDYLFAFDTGVWDLENNVFRLPLPKELITCTCEYDYIPEDDAIIQVEKNIMIFFKSIFKKKEDMDYVLFTIAQCLSGIPSREIFNWWYGLERNCKDVIKDLIKQTFGNYFDLMDIKYLNKTRTGQSVTAADEIIARKKNCRIIVLTEPDSAMEIKTNKIKTWINGDPIQCRENYGHSFNYVPKFRLFLQTNYDLYFAGSGSVAVTERLKVVRFLYSFVENPRSKNEKLLDRDLKERIKGEYYDIAFFHILLKYYNEWIKNEKKVIIPESVRVQTELLLTTADPFTSFYKDIIEKVDNDQQYEQSSNLFNAFKKYYENVSDTIRMNQIEFKTALESKGHKASTLHGRVIWRKIRINHTKLNNGSKKQIDFDDL